ncbi:MAG: cation transporter [Chloroflexia bacterium]|nr:cation transporter [Chloroflexia bacterium]
MLTVLALNLLVAFAKLGYGLKSGSVAMSADGAQSLLDGLSNVVGLVSIAVAARPPDEEHHYGHDRYETLASLIIAMTMSISVLEIVRSAVRHLISGDSPTVDAGSFVVLICTMAVNIGVAAWERRKSRDLQSDFLSADARHTLSDVGVSFGVVIGLLAVRAGFDRADSLVSILIAGIIAWMAWTILRDASLVLTDAARIDPRQLMAAILNTEGVETAHKLRARSMGGRQLVEVDITVDPRLRVDQAHDVATRVERSVKNIAGMQAQALVHVEPAVAPHTRPDRLFGDVQGSKDSGAGDDVSGP